MRFHDYRISPCGNMPFNFYFLILSPSQFFSSSFLHVVSLWQFCPRRKIQDDFSSRSSDLKNVDKNRHAASFEATRNHKSGVRGLFCEFTFNKQIDLSRFIQQCAGVFANKNYFTERRLVCNQTELCLSLIEAVQKEDRATTNSGSVWVTGELGIN